MPSSELPIETLRLRCDPAEVKCRSSAELTRLEGIIGQERALRAMKVGFGMRGKGFNVYAAGQPGTGKNTAVRRYLREIAPSKPTPSDWAYVNNFQEPYEPKALRFPPGRARTFQRGMRTLVEEASRSVPEALRSDEFLGRRRTVLKKAEGERARILEAAGKEAKALGFTVEATPIGITLTPFVGGKALSDQEFDALPPAVRETLTKNRADVEGRLDKAGKQIAELTLTTREQLRKIQDDAVRFALGHLAGSLLARHQDVPGVQDYLEALQADILENLNLFTDSGAEPEDGSDGGSVPAKQADPVGDPAERAVRMRRYEVNVIVDNARLQGAPVVAGDNPTYGNLIGRAENEIRFGALMTDFTLIKGGLLHEANGGYLTIRVDELAKNPAAYDGLKRALQSGHIAIEEAADRMGIGNTKSLRPEPIPLEVKIVLIGSPEVYETLYAEDPDFSPLFKVKADFDDSIKREPSNIVQYGQFVHTLCETEGLRHLEAPAIAKIVEHGSRLAEDQNKLSTRFSDLADVIREADFYAAAEGAKQIQANHIEKTLEEKVYRSNLLAQKYKELIARNVFLIDTAGAKVGVVNGLTVMSGGDFEFGQPSRVTASVGLGREGIVDIERESRLGGQIHTKGVLILSGYLSERFAREKPLSLACHLVFEQSYGGVEGDSASSTELYAILSALAELPIRQNLAVTGSVNQKGEIQAIGGVNEKIEGFFETCKAKGLKGDEGVVIPRANVQHLMLREDVVAAVQHGTFHVYAVKTIDEGMEMLTGAKAGQRGPDGRFEANTVNDRVDRRLELMAKTLPRFAPSGWGGPERKDE